MPSVGIELRQERVERFGGPSGAGPAVHEAGVDGDAIQPGTEPGVAAEPCDVTVGLQKGLLQHIRRVGFARQPACETEDTLLVARH